MHITSYIESSAAPDEEEMSEQEVGRMPGKNVGISRALHDASAWEHVLWLGFYGTGFPGGRHRTWETLFRGDSQSDFQVTITESVSGNTHHT